MNNQTFTSDEIQNLFTYHAPKGDQQQRYEEIRKAARDLAWLLVCDVPASPELVEAVKLLRMSVMMANAGIACNE